MSRYDRYVLSQLLLLFGLFSLILVGVFWINRAVSLLDRLIADGQSALVFLEFSALTLPNLVRITLPISAFIASVYVTNRLQSESELTVMQSIGSSPWRMAKPVLIFGVIVGVMMSILSHLLLPASTAQLEQRELEVSQNATAGLLTEGAFLHPSPGITFYIRSINEDGSFNDVFLSDRRDPDETVTYTAIQAYLVRDEDDARLIMVDGLAQRFSSANKELSTTNFDDFSYDITSLLRAEGQKVRQLRELSSAELFFEREKLTAVGYAEGHLAEELHLRFARSIVCVAVALIGFAALQLGTFSRFGVWRQITLAVFILIVMEMLRGLVSEPVLQNANTWPLVYLPAVLGLCVAALFLWLSSHPFARTREEAFP